jgi:murein DD-endopeptidase MepM/ murein hydrolase activator NlpD
MLLSPLKNTLSSDGKELQPVVTQKFGANPRLYKKFGLKGHEGGDFRAAVGMTVYAPIDGTIEVIDSGNLAYGLHVIITNDRLRVILAHLSLVDVFNNQFIRTGEPIGLSGNTGNSTAPHLHMSVIRMKDGEVQDADNGYKGAFNFLPYVICWRETLRG